AFRRSKALDNEAEPPLSASRGRGGVLSKEFGFMDISDRLLKLLIGAAFAAAGSALWWPIEGQAARLKEIAAIQGVRSNQLMGYGLVVGLDGTGDQTTQSPFTAQSLNAMLQQMGITVPAGTPMQVKNVAAVMVT